MMRNFNIPWGTTRWVLAFSVVIGVCDAGIAQSRPTTTRPTASEIMEKSDQAFYYQGNDMKADVTMDLITADGKKQTRALTMLRRNDAGGGNQKYYLYFNQPADVRRMSFLVWKYPDKEDDRWVFIPALDLVRRIAASDARSSFVGSDFNYEDVSGRDLDADDHQLIKEEKLGDQDCYVIESTPKKPVDYVQRVSWISKDSFLPLRVEYYDQQKELARVFTADKIEQIVFGAEGSTTTQPATGTGEGKKPKVFPTVMVRTMKNVKTGHRTEVTYTAVSYDVGLADDIFTERYLRRPPARWIK